MGNDGAHFGLTPDESLTLQFEGYTRDNTMRMTSAQMREYLASCPVVPRTYDDTARWAAKRILAYLDTHASAFCISDASKLFDKVFSKRVPAELSGITVFMVGWAVNAARYASKHNAVPNPAILEIEVSHE